MQIKIGTFSYDFIVKIGTFSYNFIVKIGTFSMLAAKN